MYGHSVTKMIHTIHVCIIKVMLKLKEIGVIFHLIRKILIFKIERLGLHDCIFDTQRISYN